MRGLSHRVFPATHEADSRCRDTGLGGYINNSTRFGVVRSIHSAVILSASPHASGCSPWSLKPP